MSESITCPNCGGQNPASSSACEHCSKPYWAQATPRKPGLVVSIAIGLLVYLAGCNVGLILRHMHPPTPPPAVVETVP